jgi:hypothetical protein
MAGRIENIITGDHQMNQAEMNEVATQLEEAFAQDYIEARLNKEYLPQYTKTIVRNMCIALGNGDLERFDVEIQKAEHDFFRYPQTKKVLLQYLVPSSCLE